MNGILFDLDGTLWNVCASLQLSWNRTLREKFPDVARELPLSEVEAAMGKTVDEIAAQSFGQLPLETGREIILTACEDELPLLRERGGILYDGVVDTLKALAKNYRLAIVSNCQCGYIEAFLHAHGLEDTGVISGLLCEGMTHRSKGENIREMADILGIERAVYVGDTRGDEIAARAANVPFIHAAYGFGTAQSPDAVIHSPRELPALVSRFV